MGPLGPPECWKLVPLMLQQRPGWPIFVYTRKKNFSMTKWEKQKKILTYQQEKYQEYSGAYLNTHLLFLERCWGAKKKERIKHLWYELCPDKCNRYFIYKSLYAQKCHFYSWLISYPSYWIWSNPLACKSNFIAILFQVIIHPVHVSVFSLERVILP